MRGTPSQQTIEVDVNGRKVRTVGEPKPAVPGHNLVLSLDLDLQKAATKALQEAFDKSSGFTKANQGAVIAMDPRNGKILALVSLPSYDNNLFAKGITDEAYKALLEDPLLPMYDQAIAGMYPPGSTFKIIMASAGLAGRRHQRQHQAGRRLGRRERRHHLGAQRLCAVGPVAGATVLLVDAQVWLRARPQ